MFLSKSVRELVEMTKLGTAGRRHSPTLDTIVMVEKAIRDFDAPPTRMELWDSLPRKVMYQTFKAIVDYLEASGKIMIEKYGKVVWVAFDNPRLEAFFKKSGRRA